MSTFEVKTHQIGRTYSQPHFFILNNGQNSGKPLIKTLTALSTPQEHTAFFFYCFSFKKLMVRSVAKQF